MEIEEEIIIEGIIKKIKLEVEKRKELFEEMKSIYIPEKDIKNSNIYCFLNSNPELTKVSLEYINSFQKKYNIELPTIIIRTLTEVGSGDYLNHNFLDLEGNILKPFVCLEDEFLKCCIEENVSARFIEDEICWNYNFEENKFNDKKIQSIYASLNSNRDKNLTILFDVGGHDSYITLNKENRKELAIFNVAQISNKPFQINGIEHESPYYQYMKGEHVHEGIFRHINTHYWIGILNEIKMMNLKKKF